MYSADFYTLLANLTGIPAFHYRWQKIKMACPLAYNYSPISFKESRLLAFSEKMMQIEHPK